MKQKFWQTEEFRVLQKTWEAKLREDNFADAESLINGKHVLKQRASNAYRGASALDRQAKQKYYNLLGEGFHAETFSDPVEAFVMERRSQGLSIKNICAELKSKGERCHRETVRHIILKYEAKWAVKRIMQPIK